MEIRPNALALSTVESSRHASREKMASDGFRMSKITKVVRGFQRDGERRDQRKKKAG